MTRETKLGIGIAGVFLTAVGVGVGVKLYRGGGSGESPTAPEPAPAMTMVSPAPASADSPPAGAETAPQPVAAAAPMTAPESPTPAPIVVPGNAVSAPAALKTDDPPPPSLPAPIVPQPAPTEDAKPGADSPSNPGSDAPPISLPAPVFPVPTDAGASGGNGAGAAPPSDPPKADPPSSDNPPNPSTVIIPPPKLEPAKKDEPPAPAVLSVPPLVEAKKGADESVKPVSPAKETPANTVVITKPAESDSPSVTVTPAGAGSAATLGPPGAPPAPFAGVAAPRPTKEPRVQSYLEEEHHWQPGDSFAAVSQKHYMTDRYASALQQYNRDYPLAGPGLRQNPPTIAPGQVIWVPPVRILERDYPNLVADHRPLDDRGSPVRPADPAGPSSGFGAPKLVKVRDRGETMYELARRALGDAGLWHVVHRLNPTLSRDPKLPIPAGTVLRLPPNARLEPGDMP